MKRASDILAPLSGLIAGLIAPALLAIAIKLIVRCFQIGWRLL